MLLLLAPVFIIELKMPPTLPDAMTSLTWNRHQGQQGHAWGYDVTDLGYNYRPSEIVSALGLAQLQKLEKNNQRRRELTACYHRLFQEKCPGVVLPFVTHHRASNPLRDGLPLTWQVASCEVTLPLYPTLKLEDVKTLVAAVGETIEECSRAT